MKPTIAISAGDPSGISPEIVVAALASPKVARALRPLVFGDASLAKQLPPGVGVSVTSLARADRRPGHPTRAGGAAQLAYLEAAIAAVKRGEAHGLCTAPVSKEAITRAGKRFTGHTELLAQAFDAEVVMLMDGPRLKVALATNHLSVRDVPDALTIEGLLKTFRIVDAGLRHRLGRPPRIAVCGLNPHASDGGLLGHEERLVIGPAIQRGQKAGLNVSGPFAADGLFAKAQRGFPFDVAIAMFHDQGLVATKTLDFERTVNVTLGLSAPRTSPDHGVAYDVAGKGVADERPMVEALLKAAEFVKVTASRKS